MLMEKEDSNSLSEALTMLADVNPKWKAKAFMIGNARHFHVRKQLKSVHILARSESYAIFFNFLYLSFLNINKMKLGMFKFYCSSHQRANNEGGEQTTNVR